MIPVGLVRSTVLRRYELVSFPCQFKLAEILESLNGLPLTVSSYFLGPCPGWQYAHPLLYKDQRLQCKYT